MEDAMIINKSSLDRGFAHGTLIKNETIDLVATSRGAQVRVPTPWFPPSFHILTPKMSAFS